MLFNYLYGKQPHYKQDHFAVGSCIDLKRFLLHKNLLNVHYPLALPCPPFYNSGPPVWKPLLDRRV